MKSKYIFCLFFIAVMGCKNEEGKEALFELLPSRETGIDFENKLIEDDSLNVLEFDYMYNGAGVAVGDFNNDGLSDLYFTGNMVSSRLYLNRGGLQFDDVTEEAGVATHYWCEGVTVADLNHDGFLDIYVSTSDGYQDEPAPNLLFINNGLGKDGTPTFTESAAEYGIDDRGYNTQAAFLDYNKDGYLDLYILANALEDFPRNTSRPKKISGEGSSTDKLYRNNGDGTFEDVSAEAGIRFEGYGLGVVISDINKDSWPDIYVANDFITNDLLYLNNGDGTFSNAIDKMIMHQSHNGMGADIADFNNDGFADILVLDMMPEENLRQKTMFAKIKHDKYQLNINLGYAPQFVRNTLQLNNGNGSFSEIGQLSGIYDTDWSWAPLFADFDNDGLKDIFVSNGYGKDITDLDYSVYSTAMVQFGTKETKKVKAREEMKKLIEVKMPNYIFKNNGDLTFADKSEEWGFVRPSLSNGVASADLDNDGDLDLVINNVNDPAFVFRNNAIEQASENAKMLNFLNIDLKGGALNPQGLGSKVILHYQEKGEGRIQYYEHYLSRGYKSSVGPRVHFGLGAVEVVDSLEILWPDGKYELVRNVKTNQLLTLDKQHAEVLKEQEAEVTPTLFTEASGLKHIQLKSQAERFSDFKVQSLLPHKHSENGPGLAVGDINEDGLEDFYVGGSAGYPGTFFTQNADGTFSQKQLPTTPFDHDDMGTLFFDADNDDDLDLYIVSGGSRYPAEAEEYLDRFYRNDGKGNFALDTEAIPEITASGSTVTAADFDQDGDLDLFVGGRVVPGKYPTAAKSYVLRNESGKFIDITKDICPEMESLGMVTAAVWSDYDEDGLVDLMVTGEWMPVTVFKQERTRDGSIRFLNYTEKAGLSHTAGWWNSILAEDFDRDGDMDFIAGNLGLNSKYKASVEEPMSLYAKDFDQNGSIDPIMFCYIKGMSYPVHWRDDLIGQLPYMRNRFLSYSSYGKTSFENFFKEGELEGAQALKIYELRTSYLENLGSGKFSVNPLPIAAQFSPVCGMVSKDFNRDGNPDLLLVGNSYATEVSAGQYDASIGNYLTGDGAGNFEPVPVKESGFYVPGNSKAMATLADKEGKPLILVSQYNDSLKVFQPGIDNSAYRLKLQALDQKATIQYRDGTVAHKEFYYGASYLSQSSRTLLLDESVERVTLYDYAGNSRVVSFSQQVLTLK